MGHVHAHPRTGGHGPLKTRSQTGAWARLSRGASYGRRKPAGSGRAKRSPRNGLGPGEGWGARHAAAPRLPPGRLVAGRPEAVGRQPAHQQTARSGGGRSNPVRTGSEGPRPTGRLGAGSALRVAPPCGRLCARSPRRAVLGPSTAGAATLPPAAWLPAGRPTSARQPAWPDARSGPGRSDPAARAGRGCPGEARRPRRGLTSAAPSSCPWTETSA